MKRTRTPLLVTTVFLAAVRCLGQTIIWNGTGDGSSWTNAQNWVGQNVPGSVNNVVITNGVGTNVVISSPVTVESILSTKGITISNGSLAVTSGSSSLQGALTASDGSILSASGAGTTLVASGPGNITGASLYASAGAILSLPGLVSYRPPAACEGITWQANGAGSEISLLGLTNVTGNTNCAYLTVQALNGGEVLLSGAVAELGGSMSLQADGSNSVVNLSSLAENAGTINLEASSGGSVLVPHLASSGVMNLALSDGGSVSTAQFTNISEASFSVSGGVVLSFPGVVNYQPPEICQAINWQASGAGSELNFPAMTNVSGNTNCGFLTVQALSGGHVLLTQAAEDSGGSMAAQADGSNSVVNLSSLAENAGTLNLEASGGGRVLLPQLASSGVMALTIGAGGFISAAQFTNITGASLTVSGGAVLSFPGVVTYQPPDACLGVAWQASGAGTELNFPAMTNLSGNTVCGYLTVKALSGAQVSLSTVEDIHDGYQTFLSDGTGSVIDLSKMSGMVLANGQGTLTAQNDGTILFNNQAFLLANVAISIGAGNPVLPPTLIPSQGLTLFGTPWHSYRVEEINTLQPNSPPITILVPATNNFQTILAGAPPNTAFTVTEFIANPSILQSSLSSDGNVETVLYGETNGTYQIQTATNLSAPITWAPGNSVTMTNAFHFLPEIPPASAIEFFRAKQQ